ncbi:MAG: hypothetical protein RIS29_1061 [Bacteroidota bacterium]|jgi:substrate import-associated zinc metallohydrolase lipoprotein
MIRKITYSLLTVIIMVMISCSNQDTFTDSIFDTTDTLTPSSATYEFDLWLRTNYLIPYNLDFRYKMEDVGSDMNYNLVPASLKKSEQIAKLIKYLWFDAYSKVVGQDFLKENGPRIIHLIGSPAYNPTSHTILLGTAEGGIKVTLYRINDIDPTNVEMLNEYYFKTMHHEFAHILHQKKKYPADFGLISQGYYSPLGWNNRTDSEAATLGFVSPYASNQNREDFVEVIANYLVKTDAEWNNILLLASKPGINSSAETLPDDGIDGKAIILKKLEIARTWLQESWSINIDSLRAEIQERETHIAEVIK